MWTTIRQFNTAQFTVALQWVYDEDTDIEPSAPEWDAYCFRVIVLWQGREIGADYLGGSIYADPSEFGREHYGHNHDMGRAYFPDMLREAVAEARHTLAHVPAMRIPRARLSEVAS